MTVNIEDLTFGVELEVIMPRDHRSDTGRNDLALAMRTASVDAQSESYNHANRPHWKITTDASIGYDNAEVVSPILRGEAGFDQLRRAVTVIDQFGCRVNRTTGLHVHVGVRDRFANRVGFFKELVRTYAKFEPVLDSLVAPSRREGRNTYCGPVRWGSRLEEAATVDELRRAYGGNRFVKLNLEAFSAHGTVEFRQHQGTTNAQKVENWVKMCLRLVAHAAKNTEESRMIARSAPLRVAGYQPPAPRDLTRAPRVTGEAIPRFIRANSYEMRDMAIVYVTQATGRRPGTAGRENHDRHNLWAREQLRPNDPSSHVTLYAYHRHGGLRTHLAWDVDHGYVGVVRLSTAPPIEQTVAQLLAEDRAAAAPSAPPVIERPNTDLAPATLDGLLDLIGAAEPERSFFTERQMELNG